MADETVRNQQEAEFDYTLTDAEDDALMDALHRHGTDNAAFDDDAFRAVVAGLIAPHAARARTAIESPEDVRVGFRYRDGEVLSPEREALSEDVELPEAVIDLGDGEWLTLAELRHACGVGGPGSGCSHEWLDRPESDTRECLICGTEVAG